MGTPNYMAPEVFAGSRGDEASDQFSFSVALYQAVNGRHPFRSAADTTLADLFTRMQRGIIEPGVPGVPDSVRKVIERGLSADKSARFPSMSELLAALEKKPSSALSMGRFFAAAAALIALGSISLLLIPRASNQLNDADEQRKVAAGPEASEERVPPNATPDALAPTTAAAAIDPHPHENAEALPAPSPILATPTPVRGKKQAVIPVSPRKSPKPTPPNTDEARFKDRLRNPF